MCDAFKKVFQSSSLNISISLFYRAFRGGLDRKLMEGHNIICLYLQSRMARFAVEKNTATYSSEIGDAPSCTKGIRVKWNKFIEKPLLSETTQQAPPARSHYLSQRKPESTVKGRQAPMPLVQPQTLEMLLAMSICSANSAQRLGPQPAQVPTTQSQYAKPHMAIAK